MIGIYYILVSSTQLLIGMTNLVSLSQTAFCGIGAYFTATFITINKIPFIPSLLLVFIFTGFIAFVVSFPLAKLKEDYFILATIGFQTIVYTIFRNSKNITNGHDGISGIIEYGLFFDNKISYLALVLIVSIAVYFIIYKLINSPFGRSLQILREDELLLISTGRNPVKYKEQVFIISGALAGIAGFLLASYVSYINPDNFSLDESIFILCAVIIGGLGNARGSLIGAIFVVILQEAIRFLQIDAPVKEIIYGIILLAIIYYRPRGLAGSYSLN